jgi:hypothetical protein
MLRGIISSPQSADPPSIFLILEKTIQKGLRLRQHVCLLFVVAVCLFVIFLVICGSFVHKPCALIDIVRPPEPEKSRLFGR